MTGGANAPLDVTALETIGRRAHAHWLVDEWRFRPDGISPRVLELGLDSRQYTESVEHVRVDVRWFEDSAYSFHYVEERDEGVWECRFDQHAKPDAPAVHYHPPPTAGDAEPSPLKADHHLGVCFEVLAFIEDRTASLD